MQSYEIDIANLFDPDTVEAMARDAGFVQRRSPVMGMHFLLTFTTGLLNTPDGTLAQLAAFLGATCGAEISPQAVDQRINPLAKTFLTQCLAAALKMAAAIKWDDDGPMRMFDHLYVIDSTNFNLHPSLVDVFKGSGGGASVAAARIQFLFDYRTGFMYIELGDVTLSDATALASIVERHCLPQNGVCLTLADLGYFKMATFETIHENPDRHFLSKAKFGVKLTSPDGTPLDMESLIKGHVEQFDVPVMVGSKVCRLVGIRLSDEVAGSKIRRANASQEKGRQITSQYRAFLHYALYLTSLPVTYGIKELFALYRIRWQVELTFKMWKSILAIHRIRSAKEARVRCEVIGKLIMAILISSLTAASRAILDGLAVSLHKVARHVRTLATNWVMAIQMGATKHQEFLVALTRTMARLCRKTTHRRKPSLETMLNEALATVKMVPHAA